MEAGFALLEAEGIGQRFGSTVALDGMDLRLAAGSVHALIGENGAGKSTLVRILAGELSPDSGAMRLDGARYAPRDSLDGRLRGFAHVKQELSLCPHLSVAENISLGAEPARFGLVDAAQLRQRALENLRHFPHPDIEPETKVSRLPLAARQVVEICRALAQRPRVLLLDEPTASLQRSDVERLFDFIRRLRDSGAAILYISHFLEEVREIATECTVIRDGRTVLAGDLNEVDDSQLISAMVGRAPEELYPPRARAASSGIGMAVRGLQALPRVASASFEARQGEVLGIAGLIGSGRSEMVRAIFGLEEASAGEVEIGGQRFPAATMSPQRSIAAGAGYLSEDRGGEGVLLRLSVAENVTLTRIRSCSSAGWLRPAAQAEQASRWMEALRIRAAGVWSRMAGLSGGNQQKVAVARLLHQQADVLLLDEPTRGVDVGSKAQIYSAIAALAEQGKAVVVVSSYLPELFGICDRIAVMRKGTLTRAYPVGELTPEKVMELAISGEAEGAA